MQQDQDGPQEQDRPQEQDQGAVPAQGGADYGYDLVHECGHAPEETAVPHRHPHDAGPVATRTADELGDYGYDLAHDIPPAG